MTLTTTETDVIEYLKINNQPQAIADFLHLKCSGKSDAPVTSISKTSQPVSTTNERTERVDYAGKVFPVFKKAKKPLHITEICEKSGYDPKSDKARIINALCTAPALKYGIAFEGDAKWSYDPDKAEKQLAALKAKKAQKK